MKTPVENHFLYLGKKIIYCIFKDILHNLFHFPQNAVYFNNFISSI
jgi:uncharacterized protein YhhL (DUF1145 family)